MADEIVVPSFLQFDPGFAVGVGLGFALVHTEEGVATAILFGQGASLDGAWAVVLAAAVLTFAGYLLSFAALSGVRVAGGNPAAGRVWPFLFKAWPVGATVVFITTGAVCGLYLWLAGSNLVAAYTLLKDMYVYALMGAVLTHGLVLYVRYSRIVYALRQESFVKVLVVSGGVGVMLLILTLYLLILNLQTLHFVPDHLRGAWGLHIYSRACLLITLEILIYGWHARWMADH